MRDAVKDAGGGGDVGDAGWPDSGTDGAAQCGPGTKLCEGNCVSVDNPSYGCSGTDCAPCQITGAAVYCKNLTCTLDECLPGRLDCDLNSSDGCEIDPATDVQNCGTCGNTCDASNGTSSCVAGTCDVVCNAGFGNCDESSANGCETSLTTSQHCGSCAKQCGIGFACQSGDCHCLNAAACDGGSFAECVSGTCQCAGGVPCPGGKKCTPAGCQ